MDFWLPATHKYRRIIIINVKRECYSWQLDRNFLHKRIKEHSNEKEKDTRHEIN